MRHQLLVTVISGAALSVGAFAAQHEQVNRSGGVAVSDAVVAFAAAQARPRSEPQSEPRSQPNPPPQAQPQRGRGSDPEPGRAQPRPPQRQEPRAAPERRTPAPPRVVPPQYHRLPRPYHFPPVSVQRGFYYHPYFGFYFGPYYGPYYPYPGPFFGPATFSAGAIRTRVRPVETAVYVNGYYAGEVDDFDGIFQRLYVPAGAIELTFYLDGYQSHVERIHVSPGETREVAHQMVRLPAGVRIEPPITPRSLPDGWSASPVVAPDGQPVSPFGIVAIRVQPADALVLIDGEAWLDTADAAELVVHVPAGWHTLEVRKEGYQSFRTEVELTSGVTTRLNVTLRR